MCHFSDVLSQRPKAPKHVKNVVSMHTNPHFKVERSVLKNMSPSLLLNGMYFYYYVDSPHNFHINF